MPHSTIEGHAATSVQVPGRVAKLTPATLRTGWQPASDGSMISIIKLYEVYIVRRVRYSSAWPNSRLSSAIRCGLHADGLCIVRTYTHISSSRASSTSVRSGALDARSRGCVRECVRVRVCVCGPRRSVRTRARPTPRGSFRRTTSRRRSASCRRRRRPSSPVTAAAAALMRQTQSVQSATRSRA